MKAFGVESKIRLVLGGQVLWTETVQDNSCVGNTIPSAIVLREMKLRLPLPALVTDNLISGCCFIDPDDRSLTKRQVWTQGLCFPKVYWHDIRPPCCVKILKPPSWKKEPASRAIDGLIIDCSVSRTVNIFYIKVLHNPFSLWHSYRNSEVSHLPSATNIVCCWANHFISQVKISLLCKLKDWIESFRLLERKCY